MKEKYYKKKKILISNLNKNLSVTIGNSLRRILLSYMSGYTISAIKIKNIKHEYENLEGVYEDINDIILNFKQVIFKINKDVKKKKIYIINVNLINKKNFLAGDIENFTKEFKIVNKNFIIFNISKNIEIFIKIFVTYGKGYVLFNKNKIINKYEKKKKIKNLIKIDSIYSPIINVKYFIKEKNNKENLFIIITTNGSINPLVTLYKTIRILLYYYHNIININKNSFLKKKNINHLKYLDFKYFKYFNNNKILFFFKENKISSIKDFKSKYIFLKKKNKNKKILKIMKKIYNKF
ncbi:MAG: hypothetical protein ABNO52_00745 [Candidatus Shikimatogenerans sp. Tser]|uniref:DNA-directed RNA polymerase RpoA/D/Rpb3-type domain-containing protein n=1 Tax=Candidatus Shikimatogenerans sp. Tser TaxID=3158568 RepID=A0AAU7QQW1_9FLAO